MIPPEVLAGDRQALPPTRDRLLTTTFLVASLHALVILGVTFTPPHGRGGSADPPSLEVLVVHDPVPESELNKNADWLSTALMIMALLNARRPNAWVSKTKRCCRKMLKLRMLCCRISGCLPQTAIPKLYKNSDVPRSKRCNSCETFNHAWWARC